MRFTWLENGTYSIDWGLRVEVGVNKRRRRDDCFDRIIKRLAIALCRCARYLHSPAWKSHFTPLGVEKKKAQRTSILQRFSERPSKVVLNTLVGRFVVLVHYYNCPTQQFGRAIIFNSPGVPTSTSDLDVKNRVRQATRCRTVSDSGSQMQNRASQTKRPNCKKKKKTR